MDRRYYSDILHAMYIGILRSYLASHGRHCVRSGACGVGYLGLDDCAWACGNGML
jgi:hypothetical protein